MVFKEFKEFKLASRVDENLLVEEHPIKNRINKSRKNFIFEVIKEGENL